MVFKSIGNCRRFVFYINMEKNTSGIDFFFVEKARALHLTSFLFYVLFSTIATNQSARENFDSYCKITNG